MFDQNSRYVNCNIKILDTSDGGKIQYVSRRFLPKLNTLAKYQQFTVILDDRLDRISSKIIGDPEQYWRICDVNDTMHPLDLTSDPGKVLNAPITRASF